MNARKRPYSTLTEGWLAYPSDIRRLSPGDTLSVYVLPSSGVKCSLSACAAGFLDNSIEG